MIHTGKLAAAELYNDYTGHSSVVSVYNALCNKHPGRCIVTNGHWWGPGPAAVGNYKVDGAVLSEEYPEGQTGFGWNKGEIPRMVFGMGDVDDFVSTILALVDGERQWLDYGGGVTRPAERTWLGVDAGGMWTVEVTTANYTLAGIVDRMQGMGIVDGMVFDGSGSSQCYDGETRLKGDGRTVYQFLALWFEDATVPEDEPKDEPEGETSKPDVRSGIDVSEWQGEIDWEAVKASGVEFAMLKCGSGQTGTDKQFKRNADECTRLGIPFGVYFFSYAYNTTLARMEARRCLEMIKGYKLSYPVAWDYEYASYDNSVKIGITPTGQLISDMARAFLAEIEDAGYYAALYANPDYISRYFDADVVQRYDTWLAAWRSNAKPENKPEQAGGMWQYWNKGSVDGITGDVDLDYAYYDYPAIIGEPAAPGEPEKEDKPMDWQEEQEAATEWITKTGASDGERPNDTVTRIEHWVTLWRLFGKEKDN